MRKATSLIALAVSVAVLGVAVVLFFSARREPPSASRTIVRPTGTILMSVRELARLETNELHMEKVVDLTDAASLADDLDERWRRDPPVFRSSTGDPEIDPLIWFRFVHAE